MTDAELEEMLEQGNAAILTKGLSYGDIKTELEMKRERLRQIREARVLRNRQAGISLEVDTGGFYRGTLQAARWVRKKESWPSKT